MATYIPAIRARMGDIEYFSSIMTLGEAARLIQYVEEVDDWTSETPPELNDEVARCGGAIVIWTRRGRSR